MGEDTSHQQHDNRESCTSSPLAPLHALMSARFLKDSTEKHARESNRCLRIEGVNMYMVEARSGQTFGNMTNFGLTNMNVLVAFCSETYGQKMQSPYSSFAELKHASASNPHYPLQVLQELATSSTNGLRWG